MRFPLKSFQSRYMASNLLWVLLCLIATGVLVSNLFRQNTVQGYHEEMEVHIEELSVLARVDADGQPFLVRRMSDPRFLEAGSGFYWQIRRKGHADIRSPSLGQSDIPDSQSHSFARQWSWVEGPTGQTLLYGILRKATDNGPPLELAMASDKRLVDDTQSGLNFSLFWQLGLFAAFMAVIGYIQVKFGLRPMRSLAASIERVSKGQSSKMEGEFPSEIEPLVDNLNSLIEGNTAMVKAARMQAGNLAHGLRTPLAILMDEAKKLADDNQVEHSETLLRECNRMTRQIDYHLARARVAGLSAIPGQSTDVRNIIDRILIAMRQLHGGRSLSICCSDFTDAKVACDPIDFEEMAANLVDNACKWATAKVIVSGETLDGHFMLSIDDNGPGLSTDEMELVLHKGERLDDSVKGSGLGVRIVQDLAAVYNGTFRLSVSPLGGLKAVLTLPLSR